MLFMFDPCNRWLTHPDEVDDITIEKTNKMQKSRGLQLGRDQVCQIQAEATVAGLTFTCAVGRLDSGFTILKPNQDGNQRDGLRRRGDCP